MPLRPLARSTLQVGELVCQGVARSALSPEPKTWVDHSRLPHFLCPSSLHRAHFVLPSMPKP